MVVLGAENSRYRSYWEHWEREWQLTVLLRVPVLVVLGALGMEAAGNGRTGSWEGETPVVLGVWGARVAADGRTGN